jgi:hypothetical protein
MEKLSIEHKYGKTHNIKKRKGTEVDLTHLNENESVVWGDGKTYHYLLTKK